MKLKAEIITVIDRATLREAITPYEIQLRGGLLRARVIKKKVEQLKETYWVECRTYGRRQEKNLYQVEFLKTLILERSGYAATAI